MNSTVPRPSMGLPRRRPDGTEHFATSPIGIIVWVAVGIVALWIIYSCYSKENRQRFYTFTVAPLPTLKYDLISE